MKSIKDGPFQYGNGLQMLLLEGTEGAVHKVQFVLESLTTPFSMKKRKGSPSTENVFESLSNTLALLTPSLQNHIFLKLTISITSFRTNARKQVWFKDRESCVFQMSVGKILNATNQGRPFQRNNARGNGVAGNGTGLPTVDDDVDDSPENDLALNVDHIFEADECDAFDSDVDEGPTSQTMFMANLTSEDPIYDEAGPSYDSNNPFEKLKDKIKDRLYKQDQSVQTVHMLCKPKSFYDEKHKVAIGYKNPVCLARAKQAQSALYNGHVLVTTNHTPTVIHDSEDTHHAVLTKCEKDIYHVDEIGESKSSLRSKEPCYIVTMFKPKVLAPGCGVGVGVVVGGGEGGVWVGGGAGEWDVGEGVGVYGVGDGVRGHGFRVKGAWKVRGEGGGSGGKLGGEGWRASRKVDGGAALGGGFGIRFRGRGG
ncbi:hypothetical protein Tco_0227207 [Tanacetum coccineum]